MTKENLKDSDTKKSEDVPAIYSDAFWSVVLSAKGDSLIIRTTDYHADPLSLPLARLRTTLKTDETPAPSYQHIPAEQPADTRKIGQQNQWTLKVSKKEKCLLISSKDDTGEPLRLSRKVLYSIGKRMNKRVKGHSKNTLRSST